MPFLSCSSKCGSLGAEVTNSFLGILKLKSIYICSWEGKAIGGDVLGVSFIAVLTNAALTGRPGGFRLPCSV